MKGKTKLWLAAIFLAVVLLRLFIAFQTENLDYEAYSVLRQVESIHDTGKPIFKDDLSYSGRVHIFSPVYHYFLAGFTFIMPMESVAKIIPNFLAALTIIVVFFFALYFTKNEHLSLVIAGLSGIIPVFFDSTINNASIYTAVIPLFFLTAYFFVLTHKDSKNIWKLLISMALLTIIHPFSLILVFCLLIYIVLINIENFRKNYRETELVLFFLFFIFWMNMTIYKRALLAHGDLVLLQNIPAEIISNSFKSITFIDSIYSIGIIPIIFGLIAIYAALFISNSKSLMLVTSISIGMFLLLLFKLIALDTGMVFLSISLIILSAYSIGNTYENMKMVKLKRAHIYFVLILLVISIGLLIPALISSKHYSPSKSDVAALNWLKDNSEPGTIVLALPEEGSVLSYYSERKNVMDDDYLMIRNVNSRFTDIKLFYKDRFLTTALERSNYYSVDYVWLSEYNQEKNNMTSLYFYEGSCFKLVYPIMFDYYEEAEETTSPKIYKVECKLLSKSKEGVKREMQVMSPGI